MLTPAFDEAVARIRATLATRPPRPLALPGFRRAAVLVPLLARPEGPSVLFTRRAETLPHHRGEISFPGGGLEPGESAEGGALREAEEEVGLAPATVELLGRLDDLPSPARFTVTPVVAAVRAPPPAFLAAAAEVDEPFELPLERLLDPALRRATLWDPAALPGRLRTALAEAGMPFEDVDAATGRWRVWSFHADPARVVWGLTARALAGLLDRAFGAG
ncbi:MAG TPA: CoA pyrophosphatase [Anaeromyxobacter sp.]|nr:CoA pyrophosphatase [Anaeromyxobacter sp.]